MRPLRIALYHNLPSGGAKRHTREQLMRLAQRGHHIVEFAPSTADFSYCRFDAFITEQHVFSLTPVRQTQRRVPLVTPYLNAVQGITTLHRIEQTDQLIAEEIDQGSFDLALVKDCQIAMNPYVLRYLRTPSVFQCHHGLRHLTERLRPNEHKSARSRLTKRLRDLYYSPARRIFDRRFSRDEARNIISASVLLTNSQFSRRLITDHYGLSSDVIYPGIDPTVFRPLPLQKGDYVLSVGALVYSKGHRFLVSALGRIDARRRPTLFVAANSIDPSEAEYVRELADRLGVAVHIEKIMNDDRLVEVYNQARVFVYAPFLEALGMAPLEAMACGTPVLAVSEGGIRETVVDGETGILVDRDPDMFASRLEQLLGDVRSQQRLGQMGTHYVRATWNWEHAVDRLEKHLCALVAGGGQHSDR